MGRETKEAKRARCSGCRSDYYNGRNERGIKDCWMLKSAKKVTRFRLHWHTAPVQPGAFDEVVTNSCMSQPGRFAYYERLPSHAVDPVRLQKG